MDIGSIFLILALLILVAAFITQPLRERRSVAVSEEEHTLSHLLAERDRLLTALAELDFDHDLGKIPQEIYPLQRGNLLERATEVLRQLDETPDAVVGMDTHLEAKISEHKAKVAAGDDPLEAMIATRRQSRKPATVTKVKFCPNCGEKIQAGDRFCTNCGAALN
jgi:hypothetical protein